MNKQDDIDAALDQYERWAFGCGWNAAECAIQPREELAVARAVVRALIPTSPNDTDVDAGAKELSETK
jgi:hypothetical protein